VSFGDPTPPPPMPIELVLAERGRPVLDDLDEGRSCWWCEDRHVLGAPMGACPIRLVPVDELSQRRRRHRGVLS